MNADTARKPRCFIAMPITTRPEDTDRFDGDTQHWIHVMDTILVPAIEKAGYEAIRPVTQGSHMIHGEIIKHLATAEMVLCDLSSHNPNVFFELGVRTSLNKPVALVRDDHTSLPFDTSGLNTHDYDSSLRGWAVASEVDKLAQHLRASEASCAGSNPLWRHFGLAITAAQPEPQGSSTDAKLELIQEDIQMLRRMISQPARRRPISEDSADDNGLRDTVSALATMLQARSWKLTHGGSGPGSRAEATFADFKYKASAHELDKEAHRHGFEVMSGSLKDGEYTVVLKELSFEEF